MHLCDGAPSLKMSLRPHCGQFIADSLVSAGVSYRVDRDRGSEHIEDLASPGYFRADLSSDEPIAFVASTEPWELLEFHPRLSLTRRRSGEQAPAGRQDGGGGDLEGWLTVAADQFIISPGSRVEEQALARASGDEARTVIAGYHWFTDWGRDTMISLEGLTLCTGRHREARSILRTFANYIQDGLLPNLFPEGASKALYHTVDATLWYFHALDRYHRITGDSETRDRPLMPTLKSVIEHHVKGTHFGIGVDSQTACCKREPKAISSPGWTRRWTDGWSRHGGASRWKSRRCGTTRCVAWCSGEGSPVRLTEAVG